MTSAAQRYHDMTDEELIEFVAAKMPKILERIERKPRCRLCMESIIDKIAASMGQTAPSAALGGDFEDYNRAAGHLV